MRHYQTDLQEIDQRLIAQHPGVPFLHWTRDMGTHLAFLHEPDWTGWPAKGVQVNYLFGMADREHIMRSETKGTAEYMVSHYADDKILVHHVDREGVHKITAKLAKVMCDYYVERVLRAWKKG